jgi:hypothetical protein
VLHDCLESQNTPYFSTITMFQRRWSYLTLNEDALITKGNNRYCSIHLVVSVTIIVALQDLKPLLVLLSSYQHTHNFSKEFRNGSNSSYIYKGSEKPKASNSQQGLTDKYHHYAYQAAKHHHFNHQLCQRSSCLSQKKDQE